MKQTENSFRENKVITQSFCKLLSIKSYEIYKGIRKYNPYTRRRKKVSRNALVGFGCWIYQTELQSSYYKGAQNITENMMTILQQTEILNRKLETLRPKKARLEFLKRKIQYKG